MIGGGGDTMAIIKWKILILKTGLDWASSGFRRQWSHDFTRIDAQRHIKKATVSSMSLM